MLTSIAQAQTSKTLDISAYVLDKNNEAVEDNTYLIRFAIYKSKLGGSSVWEEAQDLEVRSGLFDTQLGIKKDLPEDINFQEEEYYIGIKVGDDSESSPRKPIGYVPLALNSDKLQGYTTGTEENNIPILNENGEISSDLLPIGSKEDKLITLNEDDLIDEKFIPTGDEDEDFVQNDDDRLHDQNTDTGTDSLTFNIGDENGVVVGRNFDLRVSNNSSKPALRYNGSTSTWQYSNNGSTFSDIGSATGNYLETTGGTMTGNITFNSTQTFGGSSLTELGYLNTLTLTAGSLPYASSSTALTSLDGVVGDDTQYLRFNWNGGSPTLSWEAVSSGSFNDFTLSGDSGTDQTIADGNTLEIAGGTNISTVASATDTITVSLDSTISGTTWNGTAIGVAYGGTGLASYATGDLIYASGATTLAKLVGVATGNALISGGVSTAPSWGKIGLSTHVSGTLGAASGGTGIDTSSSTGVPTISSGTWSTSSSLGVTTGGTGTTTQFITGSIVFAGASGVYSQDNSNLFWDDSSDFLGIGVTSPTSKLHLPQENDQSTPTLSFGDGDTGFYESSDDNIYVSIAGNQEYLMNSLQFRGLNTGEFNLLLGSGGATSPVYSFGDDGNTGIGRADADQLSLIAGGIEGLRITESGSAITSDFAGNVDLDNTTNANQYGIITKNGTNFIHNFNYGDNGTVTTDGQNLFVGEGAGNLTMGSSATQTYHSSYNVFVGYQAGAANTTGYSNLFIGRRAGYSHTSGFDNTFIGRNAGYATTNGDENTFIGRSAGYSNIGGNENLFLGKNAGYNNTTGDQNVYIGEDAGRYITDGATPNQTTGTSVFIGQDTRASADGDANEIVIGNSAIGLGSNSVVLGNSSITKTALRGNVGIGTTSPVNKLDVNGSVKVTATTTTVLTGSIDPTASTSVTGVGTSFTTELTRGDRITVSGETRTVTAIGSDTTLTVDTAFSDNGNDTSPDRLPAQFVVNSGANVKFIVSDQDYVGIGGVTNPAESLQIASGNILLDNTQSYRIKDSGGTARALVSYTSLNNAQYGNRASTGNTQILNNNDTGEVSFHTGSSTTERARFIADGSFGIGASATSPTHLIELDSDTYGTTSGWTDASDRNKKENFINLDSVEMEPVRMGSWTGNGSTIDAVEYDDGPKVSLDVNEFFNRMEMLPIMQWNFVNEDDYNKMSDEEIKHIGPTAQDFYKMFGLGASDTNVKATDMAGVALFGVKGLLEKATDNELGIDNITLKTDQNASTLNELQTSIDAQLSLAGLTMNDIKLSDDQQNAELLTLEDQLAIQQISITEIESKIAENLSLIQMQLDNQLALTTQVQQQIQEIEDLKSQNETVLDFMLAINSDSFITKDEDGNVNLEGNLKAEIVEGKGFVITIDDEDAPTIGRASICSVIPEDEDKDSLDDCSDNPISKDKDGDGLDDKTQDPIPVDENNDWIDDSTGEGIVNDGKTVFVETEAVDEDSRIFVTPRNATDLVLFVDDVIDEKGFEVKVMDITSKEIGFDWWIVGNE
ncbi:beta strand repeat-containing protein [Patescibacteria group bacterium]